MYWSVYLYLRSIFTTEILVLWGQKLSVFIILIIFPAASPMSNVCWINGCIVSTGHQGKPLYTCNCSHSLNNPVTKLWLTPFRRWGLWRLSNISKGPHLESGRAGFEHRSDFKVCVLPSELWRPWEKVFKELTGVAWPFQMASLVSLGISHFSMLNLGALSFAILYKYCADGKCRLSSLSVKQTLKITSWPNSGYCSLI